MEIIIAIFVISISYLLIQVEKQKASKEQLNELTNWVKESDENISALTKRIGDLEEKLKNN